jgi:soluble lytic murein transglycosylase
VISIGLAAAMAGALPARGSELHCIEPDPPVQSIDPTPDLERSAILAPKGKLAHQDALIAVELKPYRRARWLVRTGEARRALETLGGAELELFGDRAALLRGLAHERRGEYDQAKAALLEALYGAEGRAVALAAGRALASVSGKAGAVTDQVRYLAVLREALGPEAEPELALDQAAALARIGAKDQARRVALSLLEGEPELRTVEAVDKLIAGLDRRRRVSRDDRTAIAFARSAALARRGRFGSAISALHSVRGGSKEQLLAVDLAIADLEREREARTRAEELLSRWARRSDLGDQKGEVLLRLGLVAAERYQYPKARAIFAECQALGGPVAPECALAAARVDYDDRRYADAANHALALGAADDPAVVEEALWLGGWSAYLAGDPAGAAASLERLVVEFPDSPQVEAAAYWRARSLERLERWEEAAGAYAELTSTAPLGFYGLFARLRLDTLVVLPPLLSLTPSPVLEGPPQIARALGADRPRSIDRAIALFEAGLALEGAEELLAAADHYRETPEAARGAAAILDLFRHYGRDAWVFLFSRMVAESHGRAPEDDPGYLRVWRDAYPQPFEEEVAKACRASGLDASLVYAVMRTESRFRADAVSPAGARGLMQLMPATARAIGRKVPGARGHARRYRAPEANIWLGASYLREMVERYAGRVPLALGAYNAGPGALDRWVRLFGGLEIDEFIERAPYDETRRYMRRTVETYYIYRALYQAAAPEPAALGGWVVAGDSGRITIARE